MHSFKYRFILSFVLIEAFFITLIVSVNFFSLDKSTKASINEKINSISTLSAELIKVPTSVYDLATLDEITQNLLKNNIVIATLITDARGNFLSGATKTKVISLDQLDNLSILNNNKNMILHTTPIMIDETKIGEIKLLFDVTYLNETIQENRLYTFSLIFFEILISFIIASFIGYKLTKNLEDLQTIANQIAHEEIPTKLAFKGSAEIRNLANAMYKMHEKIEHRTQKLIEKQQLLELSKEEAESANKAKSEFLAVVSHEIRTPLNGMLGFLEFALKTKLDDKQRLYLEKAKASSKNLLYIINDILDYSKIEAGKMDFDIQAFDLSTVLQSAKSLFQNQIEEKGLQLEIVANVEKGSFVLGDSLRLMQILSNLISNAIKFTSQGSIKISAEHLKDLEEKSIYKFFVQDSGIGISDEQQKVIFDKFSQADSSTTRKYGGTGLGLAIAKELTRLMGGEIWLESVPNEGSTFFFTVALDKNYCTY